MIWTHFDDCAGIGGFALAAQMAGGIATRWAREIDPYARAVYARHFPAVRLFDDVRDPLPDELAGRVDLYTCGFPCQPVSVAGRRRAQQDARWLWPHIAATLRHLRPRHVLLENVPGLLHQGMGDVLGDLATLGYDAEWECVPASAVGAPHRRDRVWIVGYAASARCTGTSVGSLGTQEEQSVPCTGSTHVADPHAGFDDKTHTPVRAGGPSAHGSGASLADPGRAEGTTQWDVEPDVGRVAHGVPARVDRLRCLGNAIVPQVAAWVLRQMRAGL